MCYPNVLLNEECKNFLKILVDCQYVHTIFVLDDPYLEWIEKHIYLSFPSSDHCLLLSYPQRIIENLYLSSELCAHNLEILKNSNIKYILSICASQSLFENNTEYTITYLKYPQVIDSDHQNIISIFQDCFNFIDRSNSNERVLVHCNQGKSRSSTIVIAYLMKKFNWSYEVSYTYVKELRPYIQPNNGFIEQLKSFERELNDKN